MSTQAIARDDRPSGELRYEVSTANDVVTLAFRKNDEELSVSVDPRSALMLASDVLAAVSTAGDGDTAAGDRAASRSDP